MNTWLIIWQIIVAFLLLHVWTLGMLFDRSCAGPTKWLTQFTSWLRPGIAVRSVSLGAHALHWQNAWNLHETTSLPQRSRHWNEWLPARRHPRRVIKAVCLRCVSDVIHLVWSTPLCSVICYSSYFSLTPCHAKQGFSVACSKVILSSVAS